MTYEKLNVLTELRKLAKGTRTKAPAWLISEISIPLVRAGIRNRDIDDLERLYMLEDPRA